MRIEMITDQAFLVRGVFSAEECADLISRAEARGFANAPITTSEGPIRMEKIRNNDRVMIDDAELAGTFWARLAPVVPSPLNGVPAIGVNERFRFYRYKPGQMFRWHLDGCYVRPNGERSQYTLIVYLNDDFEGGVTEFHRGRIVPERGAAALFYHHQRHRGAIVTSGVKYAIRTDVMYAEFT